MNHINPFIKSHLEKEKTEVKPLKYYLDGILKNRDYYILSECITLLESEQKDHKLLSIDILKACYQQRVESFRLGITGSPGVGKSTFIDSIAGSMADDDTVVGILTVDPSSTTGKGSILGDKTRMEALVKDKNIFIRPSPSNRHLGGVTEFTFEAIILCEAAGINRIFVETVGIGQSEVQVSQHTDATILLTLPGGGDSLQGIKKGILENADLVIVHKSDGVSAGLARQSAKEINEALHFRTKDNSIPVLNYSSITEEKKEDVLNAIDDLISTKSQDLISRRAVQEHAWLLSVIQKFAADEIEEKFKELGLENIVKAKLKESRLFDVMLHFRDHLGIIVDYKK